MLHERQVSQSLADVKLGFCSTDRVKIYFAELFLFENCVKKRKVGSLSFENCVKKQKAEQFSFDNGVKM